MTTHTGKNKNTSFLQCTFVESVGQLCICLYTYIFSPHLLSIVSSVALSAGTSLNATTFQSVTPLPCTRFPMSFTTSHGMGKRVKPAVHHCYIHECRCIVVLEFHRMALCGHIPTPLLLHRGRSVNKDREFKLVKEDQPPRHNSVHANYIVYDTCMLISHLGIKCLGLPLVATQIQAISTLYSMTSTLPTSSICPTSSTFPTSTLPTSSTRPTSKKGMMTVQMY